jgi:hypothetical protein
MELKDMRALRDKHIAHSDDVVDGYVPILDVAKKATWFYHDHVVSREAKPGDLAALPLNLESGYMECETEARAVYRRNLRS